jgi:hypothetical protein
MTFLSACSPADSSKTESDVQISLRPFDLKVGTKFTPLPLNPFKAPALEEVPIKLPASIDNANAIWGATGRDDEGNIYFGISTHGIAKNSGSDSQTAYLYQYNPTTLKTVIQSDVLTELKRAGIYREGMGQNKIHSKIYQANDGYLYFSSLDEAGEDEGVNPTWGGHLWRKKPNASQWEHIISTEEALVAVNTNGRYVYTLGYWDHVLYQFDTKTQKTARIVVGSVSTHVSRNFLVDENGHVFVPSLKENDYNEIEVYLNEYDTQLKLIGQYPMPNYKQDKIKHHHGIVGYTSMENGDILFTTSDGGLYQLKLNTTDEHKLVSHGDMHPDGKAYTASLFTFAGEDFITGLANVKGKGHYWLIFDIASSTSISVKINVEHLNSPGFWGTLTKDNSGSFYLGGWQKTIDGKKHVPALIKMSSTNEE